MIQELIPVIGLYMALLMSGYPPHEAEKIFKESA
jgi:hypothetical protein